MTSDQGYADQGYVEQAYTEIACPTCGTVNPPTRRFCSHCGYSFVAADGTDPYVDWSAWTPQAMAARDREAARAYRRSLPPLYRWRRVIIAVIVFALFIGFGALLQLGPVALAKDGWHRLTKQYVTVSGVQVMVNPTTASAPDSNPQSLVDSSKQEWTMAWAPTGRVADLRRRPGNRHADLHLPGHPGAAGGHLARTGRGQPAARSPAAAEGDRDRLPRRLLPPGHPGATSAEPQQISVDSGAPVTQLRLGIASTYPRSTRR